MTRLRARPGPGSGPAAAAARAGGGGGPARTLEFASPAPGAAPAGCDDGPALPPSAFAAPAPVPHAPPAGARQVAPLTVDTDLDDPKERAERPAGPPQTNGGTGAGRGGDRGALPPLAPGGASGGGGGGGRRASSVSALAAAVGVLGRAEAARDAPGDAGAADIARRAFGDMPCLFTRLFTLEREPTRRQHAAARRAAGSLLLQPHPALADRAGAARVFGDWVPLPAWPELTCRRTMSGPGAS